MTCENGPNRLARLAGRLGAGITQMTGKCAYSAGRTGCGVILAGSVAAAVGVAAVARRRRQPRNTITATISPMAGYSPQEFDLKGGQELTENFGGAKLSEKSLELAVGPGSRSQPVLKMGGEDDIFLWDGPNGHIYYTTPDESLAQIVAVIPRRGRNAELMETLDEVTPKYVIADRTGGNEYETRDPEMAQRYELALGDDGEVIPLWPGDETFGRVRKPAPPALF